MSSVIAVVKENSDFVRNESTNAIVNRSETEYERFVSRKKKKLMQERRVDVLEDKIQNINNKLDSLITSIQGK